MTDFKIVEYEPSHAAGLAEMWSRSGDSWGGYSVEFTEESIQRDMERSVHVGCFLAVAGEEVVGYCKVGTWAEEEGSLYVDTLNVRPDFHGKKIGKALMLKAVERTIELGWPRLDLDTWPGNTKAVPLYKKTGFFWEEREGDVYLVNFIPEVLANELVKDRFQTIDWYTGIPLAPSKYARTDGRSRDSRTSPTPGRRVSRSSAWSTPAGDEVSGGSTAMPLPSRQPSRLLIS